MTALVTPDPEWIVGKHGLLNLRALRRNGRTEIDPHSWRIPLQWQGYHYQDHDDQPFVLILNSAGGFVEGDVAEIHVTLEAGTRMLATGTGASRFYKCPGGAVSQELFTAEVGDGALFEYLPDEAIPFAESRVERRTVISLAESARLFASDIVAAGRIHYGAAGEAFAFSSLLSEIEVRRTGRSLALDRLVAASPDEVAALRRLWANANHMITVIAVAPDLPPGIEDEAVDALRHAPVVRAGASRIGPMIVARALANETYEAHETVFALWRVLRPALAGKPARPIRKS
ncbi:MAG: urease accessory protein UreD [Alphaproteobacteria bacterium]